MRPGALALPERWIRPIASERTDELCLELRPLSGCGLDISSQPALWGALLKGFAGPIMARSGTDLERATGAAHAADLVEAHLIEVLSCLGKDCLDVYCLQVRAGFSDEQVEGVLGALEGAIQDGMVRHLGIAVEGEEAPGERVWRLRDAFDLAVLNPGSALHELAAARGVRVLRQGDTLLEVRSPADLPQEAVR